MGTVIVWVARSTDCPAADVYGPVTTGADSNVTGFGPVMVLLSKVTAAFSANSRPSTVAPVSAVMAVKARMFPTKSESVPRVAELPTCQKTLPARAPLVRTTWLLEAVISVDPAWKIQTAFGLFVASSVRVPVIANELGSL